jgi:glycosyltransferase involved in cell wall biosynthesis
MALKMMSQFTIVIPLYNKADCIERALNSIEGQTYKNYEVLIIDDGSTDDSVITVEKWLSQNRSINNQYRLVKQRNAGVSFARNKGIFLAKNDYIAFLDADDFWKAEHLAELSELINRYSSEVNVFSTALVNEQDQTIYYPKLAQYENFIGIVDFFKVSLISNGFIHSSSVCVKKDSFKNILFPEHMTNYEDVITWARLSSNKGFAFSSKRTAVYVIENAEASINVKFDNYICFNELIKTVDFNNKNHYLFKFYLLHLLFCRSNTSLRKYSCYGRMISINEGVLWFCYWVVFITPKFVIKPFRNIRKKHQT